MNLHKWIYSGQSVIGTSHEKTNKPCQDAYKIEVINDFFIASVADGAGSAKYSQIASEMITKKAIYIIKEWLSSAQISISTDKDKWGKKVDELVETLRNELAEKSKEIECDLKELATTFLFVLVSPGWIAGAQIGDGAIVYGVNNKKELQLLTYPTSGEYINETTFLTSKNYLENLQIAYSEKNIDRICLFSDGMQMIALDMKVKPPQAYLPFFSPLFEFLKKVEKKEERDKQLIQFLSSPRVCSRTDDDKTMIIAIKSI